MRQTQLLSDTSRTDQSPEGGPALDVGKPENCTGLQMMDSAAVQPVVQREEDFWAQQPQEHPQEPSHFCLTGTEKETEAKAQDRLDAGALPREQMGSE